MDSKDEETYLLRKLDENRRVREGLELQLAELRRKKISESPVDTRTLLNG